jgi:hypothetical protein
MIELVQKFKAKKNQNRSDAVFFIITLLYLFNGILFAQSPEDYDTDVLQESLYVRIVKILTNKESIEPPFSPDNIDELLTINQRYYPGANLSKDTLFIPYPARKVKELHRIEYTIPPDYFDKSKQSSFLKPNIKLSFNARKSTVTMNNSYPMSFYRSPQIAAHSPDRTREAIEYIFDIILPCGFSQIDHLQQVSGIIYFRGYSSHEIELRNNQELFLFLECLRRDGSLYFYPSKIDDLEHNLMIFGLLYVMNVEFPKLYHFGELTVIFNKGNIFSPSELKLILYPFIKNVDAM